jgi:hypothetical protein
MELDKMRAKQQKADMVAKLGLMATSEILNSQEELIRLTAEVTRSLDAAWGSMDTINHVLLVCDVADIKYIEGKNNIVADFLSRYHGMNIHVTDVKYDEGRVNAAVAALSRKDLGAAVQMIDASPFRIRVLQRTDSQLKAIKDDPAVPASNHENPTVGKSVHCKIPATVIDDILYVRASLRKGQVIRKGLARGRSHGNAEGDHDGGSQ